MIAPKKSLQSVFDRKYIAEEDLVAELLSDISLSNDQLLNIEGRAAQLVRAFRDRPQRPDMLDSFLQEYGLSNQEGIALMCLAEALLRVPDKITRDDLIADKIAPQDWASHLGKANSPLVNFSTIGLLMTGRVTAMDDDFSDEPVNIIEKMINRLGEPVIRRSVVRAMKIFGGEFVLGETLDAALRRGKKFFGSDQIYSFDMLGEGARTFPDAKRYFEAYKRAIEHVGKLEIGKTIFDRSGISVKLSAIHPRYEYLNKDVAVAEIGAGLLELAQLAAKLDIKLTVDAEEADRLEISLEIFEFVSRKMAGSNWSGFGLAIQAYGKRARQVIGWVAELGRELNMKYMVRLVKGAYWDSEIKHAQELGLPGFPVFTRKSTTDLSYMVCAQDMLAAHDVLFAQFATHNAHTIAAIMEMAGNFNQGHEFEFQRLHGMGEAIYEVASQHFQKFPPVRIYAPVGGHKDLLAYLVRRLLENGANSSFVNRFMDAEIPPRDVVRDPVTVTNSLTDIAHPQIPQPARIFGMDRNNSKGFDMSVADNLDLLNTALEDVYGQRFKATSIWPFKQKGGGETVPITNPANLSDVIGEAQYCTPEDIDRGFAAGKAAQKGWDRLGGAKRAAILRKAADALEADTMRFMAILTREAGKTHDDTLAEVREAVDFFRYYADQAEREFETAEDLPGPTGEANSISLCGCGVFVCISPWNFPLAIFLGQLVAALAAGNAVIAKPAEQTCIVAHEAINVLHEAGVPKDVLMLALGDGKIGAALTAHKDVAGVAFTGSTGVARIINRTLAEKDGPIVPLIAETGGQNVMFVDSTALLEQVTDDVIQSAFKSAGQRCSALRVLYLQDDIADNAITMIKGAMEALNVGDPRMFETDIGPIIDQGALTSLTAHANDMKGKGALIYGVSEDGLEAGTFIGPKMYKINGNSELSKEHFGPILHVIRYKASKLDETLESAFSTGYGLTLGIHTRMDKRWNEIFERAPVGNTYVNRNITGAVVGSQPFGGQGLSGTGFKAGGPRYLYRFAHEKTLTVNTMASGGNADLLTLE